MKEEAFPFIFALLTTVGRQSFTRVLLLLKKIGLDNLSTHKPRNDQWLQRHKNVHFYYTPTHASWLNMVEIWFSLLSRHALKGQSFHNVKQLMTAIQNYMDAYNKAPHPFEWTKEKVSSKTLKSKLR